MRKALSFLSIYLLLTPTVDAGLITHSDYTAGSVITAAAQNSNENTIVNEFNGNIAASNLASNAVTTAKITDGNVTYAKLESTVQSTFTFVNQLGQYRRPVLKFINTTTVDIENNTGTANQTCVAFPDQVRCVTENTGSTSVNRRFIIGESASNSGTKNSGLRATYNPTGNSWYALYAWKVSDNSTDFVIVGDSIPPTQTNYAALNTAYGQNAWTYLGLIRDGDASGATTSILAFVQSGSFTYFDNITVGNVLAMSGPRLASSAAVANLTWSYSAGMGTTDIPNNVFLGVLGACSSRDTVLSDSSTNIYYAYLANVTATNNSCSRQPADLTKGARIQGTSGTPAFDIYLTGYTDSVLGGGTNPLL